MKHQISKVALMATLACIGVGFAGTQQANAAPCDPHEFFEDEYICQDNAAPTTTCYPAMIVPAPTTTPCYDTDGDCFPETFYDKSASKYACFVNEEQYYDCNNVAYDVAGYCI